MGLEADARAYRSYEGHDAMNSCEVGWYVLGFIMPILLSVFVAILSGSFGEYRQTDWIVKDKRADTER